MSDVLYCRQEVLMRCIPVATVMLACVQVIRVDGVQAAKASLLEIRLESRWFHSKLLSKPSLVFGFPKAWLYPRWGTWAQSAGACRGVRDHVPLGDMTGTCICICTLFILRHLMRHDALHYGWIIDVRPLCRPEGGNGLLLAQSEHLLSTRPRCRGRRDSRVAVYHTSVDRP